MNNGNQVLFLKVNSDRPDFRVIGDFIWGEHHSIDSDGDSYNPATRKWTELYIGSREIENEYIEIIPLTTEPLILQIQSPNPETAIQVTLFLSEETKGIIFMDEELATSMPFDDLAQRTDFTKYQLRRERANSSIWRQSTLDNPYPNLMK